jgi:hypothetical protein
MTEPKYRAVTKNTIVELADELQMPYDDTMQDWPFEVVKPTDIDKYISHYRLTTDEDKKILLMEAIIQATNDQESFADFHKYWDLIKPLLTSNFLTHEYSIYDWASFDEPDLKYCWTITPNMRDLWAKHRGPANK